ncbi:MAG: alanine--tRNA ligase [Clostridiales bacterium]|nr:alanine--tRNA ligase [Clostridiales bacterium]
MNITGLNEIRKSFLDFFESKDHYVGKSYSLVPQNDKSLLLVNAGMAPLKTYFTGEETPPSKRMATCQRCMRTADIDNVGHTSRHATFFEMLGNFSFGDYFKVESLEWGWEYITEVLGLPVDNLWATVYLTDDEAYDIWKDVIKIDENRIVRLGKEDNFWEKGTGPCGPCSEIYYDRGEKYGCDNPDCKPGCECDRFIEFWNHVFTQFDKDAEGNYNDLANPNIDTGMGLERIACIMQDVESIFEIDTMKHVLDAVVEKAGITFGDNKKESVSVKIITDHVRAITFMVLDGVMPNNEGRGYILRKVLRRAYRHGKLLNIEGIFLTDLVDEVIEISKAAYPELVEKKDYIKKVIALEEERFQQTINQGLDILKGYITDLKGEELSGEKAFKLYDTYGFPIDLTKEILAEENLTVDEKAFNNEMKLQKERARAARGNDQSAWEKSALSETDIKDSIFNGYSNLTGTSKVLAIVSDGELVDSIGENTEADIVLDQTTFYPEGGGQAGDKGLVKTDSGIFVVTNTIKGIMNRIIHHGYMKSGLIQSGDMVETHVDAEIRMASARNHTATHILHKVLKETLGDHVEQKGSLVDSMKLRFDFSHFEGITAETLQSIENQVNERLFETLPVQTEQLAIDEAKKRGATALFGEKYGDTVRVVTVGEFSMELCGGTHVENASQIGLIKIISESGIAAGVRRIEAITGKAVYNYLSQVEDKMKHISNIVKGNFDDVETKVESLANEVKSLHKEVEKMKSKAASSGIEDIINNAKVINGLNVITGKLKGVQPNNLRELADKISDKIKDSVVVLASDNGEKVALIAMADEVAVNKGAHAGNIIKVIAKMTGGGGGGRPNMAQAGGKDGSKIDEALEMVSKIIDEI